MKGRSKPAARDGSVFFRTVERVVRAIPPGETLFYAQVALRAGRPGGARSAARAMRFCSKGTPWWRVIRSDRTLAAEVAEEQARRLRKEGVTVRGPHRGREGFTCSVSSSIGVEVSGR